MTTQPFLVGSLREHAAAMPASAAVVALGVLLGVLLARTAVQCAVRRPRRELLRQFDIIIGPLLVVFVIVVVERFRDLT